MRHETPSKIHSNEGGFQGVPEKAPARRGPCSAGCWARGTPTPPEVGVCWRPGPALPADVQARLLSAALQGDDTPIAPPRRTAQAWVCVADAANPNTVFDLSVGRSREAPATFAKDYMVFVHADGYAVSKPVYEGGATHVGCWMH